MMKTVKLELQKFIFHGRVFPDALYKLSQVVFEKKIIHFLVSCSFLVTKIAKNAIRGKIIMSLVYFC
jgi:hypothetical protein